ncbi:MAG: stage II sporulation protein M [Thermaerobacter sp.]|nr:stage II sporulation protein M [Thermaerobacter sp.]
MGWDPAGAWDRWWDQHRAYSLLVMAAFLLGTLLGALAVNVLPRTETAQLAARIRELVSVAAGPGLPAGSVFLAAAGTNLKVLGLIYILSLSVAGMPLVLLAVLFRGFVLGFALALMLTLLPSAGVGLALVAVVLPNLLLVPAWLATGSGGVAFSWHLLSRPAWRGRGRLWESFGAYSAVALLAGVAVVAGSGTQAVVTPWLMKSLVHFGV